MRDHSRKRLIYGKIGEPVRVPDPGGLDAVGAIGPVGPGPAVAETSAGPAWVAPGGQIVAVVTVVPVVPAMVPVVPVSSAASVISQNEADQNDYKDE